MTEFTRVQIHAAITAALADGNIGAAAGLIRLLAIQAPEDARALLNALGIGGVVK